MPSETPSLPLGTLRRLAAALSSLEVGYAVIGGVAIAIMSIPRFTEDVDAVLSYADSNIDELLQGLQRFGFTPRASDAVAFARKNRMILLKDESGTNVDLSLGALPFELETIEAARMIKLEPGLTMPVATPEALVVMKCIASRPKDLEDIRSLLSINLDIDRQKALETVKEFAELLEHPEMVIQLERLFNEHPVV